MSPSLIRKWSYDKSVAKMRPLVLRWKTVTEEMLAELRAARKALSHQGMRTDLTSGQMTRSWSGYLADIGLEKRTVNRWLLAEMRSEAEATRSAILHRAIEQDCYIYHGDFRELSPQIVADESVHFVLTDPPYDEDSIELYEDAAREAARILRPGGSMIAYCGQKHLFQVGELMSRHLKHWWTFALIHNGSAQLLQKLGVRCYWKPLIWMVKDTRGDVSQIVGDLVDGSGREKTLHTWQQAEDEAREIIELFTRPGEVVADFFCGSGTIAAAAKASNRSWIAFDIDESSVREARNRLGL